MAKLPVLSCDEVCGILRDNGFKQLRVKGSHITMQKPEGDSTITVIVPSHSEIRPGTLMSIIRQSKLGKDAFVKR